MEGDRGELIPRITRRCLTDDLGLPTDSVDYTIDELATANDVIAAFRDRRAEVGSPGQEPIRSLLPDIVAFSLHVGRRRGATWHHRGDLVAAARKSPGVIHSGLIGGRIRVRVVCEAGDPAMLTVAISQRLFPGEMSVPADWLVRVAAAFHPDTPSERLSVAFDLAGQELQPDEVAFCDFAK
jgi:hypothetical protein